MRPEKMTDEELVAVWPDVQVAKLGTRNVYASALVAHIAALTAERDELRKDYEAEVQRYKDGLAERDALRERVQAYQRHEAELAASLRGALERVQALEADVIAQCQATMRETVRADKAEARLEALHRSAVERGLAREDEIARTYPDVLAHLPPPPWARRHPNPSSVESGHKLGTNSEPTTDKERGLYAKYRVERMDGTSEPGGKHHGCPLFVLDVRHDRHARPALLSYASSCESEFPALAADLRSMVGSHGSTEPSTAEAFATVHQAVDACAGMFRLLRDAGLPHTDGSVEAGVAAARAALSLLERHVGAMEAAIHMVLNIAGEGSMLTDGERSILHAALSAAPPVFTLEEVEKALLSTGIGPVAREQVRGCLTALRGGGR